MYDNENEETNTLQTQPQLQPPKKSVSSAVIQAVSGKIQSQKPFPKR